MYLYTFNTKYLVRDKYNKRIWASTYHQVEHLITCGLPKDFPRFQGTLKNIASFKFYSKARLREIPVRGYLISVKFFNETEVI